MAFGYHSRGGPRGRTYIYRNIADLRRGTNHTRPSPEHPKGDLRNYHIHLTHGREMLGVESIYYYQNTLVAPGFRGRAFAHRMLANASQRTQRRVLNNVCVYLNSNQRPGLRNLEGMDIVCDGNLHWCSKPDVRPPKGLLEEVRASAPSQASKKRYPPGWAASSVWADPKFRVFSNAPDAVNDYRLQPDSAAVGGGVVLPKDFEDPLRPKGGERPDMGALPLKGRQLRVGRGGRFRAGIPTALE
jgi:hypothetical protein